jgi:hypothetical protein
MPTVAPVARSRPAIASPSPSPEPMSPRFRAVADGSVPHFALDNGHNGHKQAEAHDGLLAAARTLDGKALLTAARTAASVGLAPTARSRRWPRSAANGSPALPPARRARSPLRRARRPCHPARRQAEAVRASALGRRHRLCAQGHAHRGRALQWRDAAFPRHRRQADRTGMGRRAYRGHLLARRQFPRHRHAGRARCMAGSSPTASTCACRAIRPR